MTGRGWLRQWVRKLVLHPPSFARRAPNGQSAPSAARSALAGLVIASGLLASCGVRGLSFVTDDRIKIVEPAENATVSLPFEVVWTAEDHEGYVALFFDRSPMRPDQSLRSLVPEEDPCRSEATCPDAQWLADRNIYLTGDTRLAVDRLPDRRDNNRAKDRHDLTIVVLDESGQRTGESAFTREFIVERER